MNIIRTIQDRIEIVKETYRFYKYRVSQYREAKNIKLRDEIIDAYAKAFFDFDVIESDIDDR